MNDTAMASDELIARPRKTTVGCWIAAVGVLIGSVVVALGMGKVTEGGGMFHAADQYAMVGLGILGALGIVSFTRPRVWADDKGVRIRNVVGGYDLPWQVITAVSFPRGASWAQLELADDDVVSVMAIQAVDKEAAIAAVRRLRVLLAEAKGG